MAVTQYIGSRYVPLFADPIEWSSAKSYEPLTIVIHEGNSYTSKQYVPEGIEIDNEEFWAITGNYNAQVEQYRRDVAEAVEDIESLENILPKNAFENTTVKNYIDDIGNHLDSILPSNEFEDTTVKDYVDDSVYTLKSTNMGFIHGTVDNTTYYLISFKKNAFNLEMKLAGNGLTKDTIINCVERDKPFYAFNSSANDTFVFNGTKFGTNYKPPARGGLYGLTENGFDLYQCNGNISAWTLADLYGYDYVFGGWQPLRIAGENVTITDYETFSLYENYGIVGFDNENWYVGQVFGRMLWTKGARMSYIQQMLENIGIPNAYCTDGGDSMRHFFGNVSPDMLSVRYNNSNNDRDTYYYMAITPKEV